MSAGSPSSTWSKRLRWRSRQTDAAFGSSKHLVTGPMAATAALSAAAVGDVAAGHQVAFAALTATLAITVGILAVLAGLLRLGFLANFISEPVLKGFIVGLALTIM